MDQIGTFHLTMSTTQKDNQSSIAPRSLGMKICTDFFNHENLIASLDYFCDKEIWAQSHVATKVVGSTDKSFVQPKWIASKYFLPEMGGGVKKCASRSGKAALLSMGFDFDTKS